MSKNELIQSIIDNLSFFLSEDGYDIAERNSVQLLKHGRRVISETELRARIANHAVEIVGDLPLDSSKPIPVAYKNHEHEAICTVFSAKRGAVIDRLKDMLAEKAIEDAINANSKGTHVSK